MRAAIFQGAFPPGLGLPDCFRLVREAGFQGVELSLENPGPLLPEAINETTDAIRAIEVSVGLAEPRPGGVRLTSTAEEIATIREQARETGLVVTSVSTMQLFYYPLSSPLPAVREQGCAIVRKMLEATAQLGGDLILITPGMVTPDVPYDEVWRRSRETIAGLIPYAREVGVTIALENVWNKFLSSPLEFRDYIDSFESDYVGAYFDVANVLRFGYPDQWIRILGPRLKRVHFKDYRLDIDDLRGFTALLQGDVPWARVMDALEHVGYRGWVVVEVQPYRTLPEQAIADAAQAVRRLLAMATQDSNS
ncbi:MAG: sugar phosphate isomerase/epimerase [Anaerolineae bacterium]|nr:sugar phosphate isomerase/epimerase [Anaerolineae bacterium]